MHNPNRNIIEQKLLSEQSLANSLSL